MAKGGKLKISITTIVILAGIGVGIYYLVMYLKRKESYTQQVGTGPNKGFPTVTIDSIVPVSNTTDGTYANVITTVSNCTDLQCTLTMSGEVTDKSGNPVGGINAFGSGTVPVTNGQNTIKTFLVPSYNSTMPNNVNVSLQSSIAAMERDFPGGSFSGPLNFPSINPAPGPSS